MFHALHTFRPLQLVLGLVFGFCFGFLLDRAGVNRYDVLINQLLLEDFTVAKVMLSAVAVGLLGVFPLQRLGLVRYSPVTRSAGALVLGGLLFGAGFGLSGYCPGTAAAAAGHGGLDALLGVLPGLLVGAWLFIILYPSLKNRLDSWGPTLSMRVDEALGFTPLQGWLAALALVGAVLGGLRWAGL